MKSTDSGSVTNQKALNGWWKPLIMSLVSSYPPSQTHTECEWDHQAHLWPLTQTAQCSPIQEVLQELPLPFQQAKQQHLPLGNEHTVSSWCCCPPILTHPPPTTLWFALKLKHHCTVFTVLSCWFLDSVHFNTKLGHRVDGITGRPSIGTSIVLHTECLLMLSLQNNSFSQYFIIVSFHSIVTWIMDYYYVMMYYESFSCVILPPGLNFIWIAIAGDVNTFFSTL